MTVKEMCTESASASPERSRGACSPDSFKIEEDRMLKYKIFSVAFSYPEGEFSEFFKKSVKQIKEIAYEYDRLFRAKEIWLYGVEHTAKNEFQRSNFLSDIMGFYKAFGLKPDKDRPDSLNSELEFMHYLIFKRLHALKNNYKEKAIICFDAQVKFFNEHLYPAAKKIAEKIISKTDSGFYNKKSKELLEFLELEKSCLSTNS